MVSDLFYNICLVNSENCRTFFRNLWQHFRKKIANPPSGNNGCEFSRLLEQNDRILQKIFHKLNCWQSEIFIQYTFKQHITSRCIVSLFTHLYHNNTGFTIWIASNQKGTHDLVYWCYELFALNDVRPFVTSCFLSHYFPTSNVER